MKNSKIIEIKEKHLSPKVLPKEQASGWIKWKKGVDFEKIILKYEADVSIFRLFNVDEEIFEGQKNWDGKVEIPKSMIQIDGFFGFTAYYNTIPESEREVSYNIEIVTKDTTQRITLTNTVTRPMIEVEKYTPEQIIVSDFSPPVEPLSMALKSKGTATIQNLSFFIDFISNDQLKVKITKTRSSGSEVSFSNAPKVTQTIEINGKGSGMIRIGVEYFDEYKTKYSDILKEIPIIVKQKQNQSIPIAHKLSERGAQLLTLVK